MEISNTTKRRASFGSSRKIKPQHGFQPSSLGLTLNCTGEHSTTSTFLDKIDKRLEDRFRKQSTTELNGSAPLFTRTSSLDVGIGVPVEVKSFGIPSFGRPEKPIENPGFANDTSILSDIAIKTCKEATEFELLSIEELDKVKETIREVQQKIASMSDEYIREKQIREGMLSMISMFAFNATGMSNATKEFELTDARLELTSTEILTLTKRLARFQEKLWKHTAAAILLRVNQLETQLNAKKPEGNQKESNTNLLLSALEAHVLLLEKSLEILKKEYLEAQSELDQAWNITEKTELENREMKLQLRKIEEVLSEITHERNRESLSRWSDFLRGEEVIEDADSGIVCSGETSPTDSAYSFDSVQLPLVAMTLLERIELMHKDQQVYIGYINRLESDITTLKEEKTSPPLKSLKDIVFRQWVNDRKADELICDEGSAMNFVELSPSGSFYYQETTLRPPTYHPGTRMSGRIQSPPKLSANPKVNSEMDLLIKENEFLRIMISELQERENTWIREELTNLSENLLASVDLLEKETAEIEKELFTHSCDYLMDIKSEIQNETEIDSGIESGCESGNSSPKTPMPGPLPDYEEYLETSPTLSLSNLTFDETKLVSLDNDCSLGCFHLPLSSEGLDRDVKGLSTKAWIH